MFTGQDAFVNFLIETYTKGLQCSRFSEDEAQVLKTVSSRWESLKDQNQPLLTESHRHKGPEQVDAETEIISTLLTFQFVFQSLSGVWVFAAPWI